MVVFFTNRVERGLGSSLPLHRTYGSVYGATSWYGFRHYCLLLRRLLAKFNRFTCPPFQPLRVTIPLPWLSLRVRATVDLLTVTCNTTTLGPSGTASPTMASADSRSLAFLSHSAYASLTGPPGVRHDSFTAQPLDLPSRFYVYLLGFGLCCNLTHRLALYPVSVRRLVGFATPLPPPLTLPSTACGSLHLAVATRGGTFTRENRAMPGTQHRRGTRHFHGDAAPLIALLRFGQPRPETLRPLYLL